MWRSTCFCGRLCAGRLSAVAGRRCRRFAGEMRDATPVWLSVSGLPHQPRPGGTVVDLVGVCGPGASSSPSAKTGTTARAAVPIDGECAAAPLHSISMKQGSSSLPADISAPRWIAGAFNPHRHEYQDAPQQLSLSSTSCIAQCKPLPRPLSSSRRGRGRWPIPESGSAAKASAMTAGPGPAVQAAWRSSQRVRHPCAVVVLSAARPESCHRHGKATRRVTSCSGSSSAPRPSPSIARRAVVQSAAEAPAPGGQRAPAGAAAASPISPPTICQRPARCRRPRSMDLHGSGACQAFMMA